MPARSSAKNNTARSRRSRPTRLATLEGQLPPTLREFARVLRKRLDRLERDIAKAQLEARRRAASLLREASLQLGRLEVSGEAGWRKLGASYQRELVALLKRLEKTLSPPATRKSALKSARKPALKSARK